tara:strand:+ start:13594 stop:14745 length:1152 start_codon:yes stop_codon:yes gene_type:complete
MQTNYSLSSSTFGAEEKKAMFRVIESGNYTMGKYVQVFEENFARKFGSKYAIMVNSGSSANLIAVASLFYKSNPLCKGDEIIVPAVSWSTSYSPLQQYGLKLVFVDIDIDTLNYDLRKLEIAISNKTKMILTVNLLGNPNEFDSINKIIDGKEIIILEDNCESMGAKYKGKFTGSIGLLGTFSLFYSHHLCTMEGGVILTDNEELYHIMLSLRAHGWTRNLPNKNSLVKKFDDPFKESFRFILPGYNLRPLEISAAVGVEQLKKHDDFLSQRIKNANYFKSLFENDKRFTIQRQVSESSWFGFSIILNNHSRKEILRRLQKNNIEFRPIVSGNFLKNETLKYFDYEIRGRIESADKIDKNGFFVGNHHFEIKDKIDLLYKTLT